MLRLLPILLLVLLGGCQAEDSDSVQQVPQELTQCKEPRPQMCTMQYDPVCAWMPESGKWKTASNGCDACADKRVAGYLAGECNVQGVSTPLRNSLQ
ncbi:hypothetical protein [Solemya velum gill symbiont]|uniref:hypothetical protein n=1 Tax=Solemya velum gill symbiont TaxID=2340 RepID=UPI00099894EA|nr:hypothetical protein [Solemya velum gill symbiont]OOZ43603.1 hypothetical protein BOW37_09880 [Solemya velum gill symbiont]OOZ45133.1 hypothetical protein BOW38_10080 [Solemya velum gill symbiont]OOZ48567.1 hypothetical protein BOW39_09735 [Solemya velum gill symbiont]OOZ50465.1 hypothetical protein BOW40_09900 [Solemya velum gill symbiont]OOZ53373.1 hypothetical protein BOW41_10130 [Solemya velum gill symbiont]